MTKAAIRTKQIRRVAQWAKDGRAKTLLAYVSKGMLCFENPESGAVIKVEAKEAM